MKKPTVILIISLSVLFVALVCRFFDLDSTLTITIKERKIEEKEEVLESAPIVNSVNYECYDIPKNETFVLPASIESLISRCKCGVYLSVNEHRDYYESVEAFFDSNPIRTEELEDLDVNIYKKMKELDTVVELTFYPDTPIGSYTVYHYDVEKAIKEALNIIFKET